MKIALDSNLLIYLARVWKVEADFDKTARIRSLLRDLANAAEIVVPYQALGEAYRVMVRYGFPRQQCRERLHAWAVTFETVPTSSTAFAMAIDLATDHKLQIWDALIVSIAEEAGCRMLLSEDLQNGFVHGGLTIIDPLAAEVDVRLTRLLTATR